MRGDFKVMIGCCPYGNCSRCRADGDKSRRKFHAIADRLDEKEAHRVADAWRNFDAYVLPMDESDKQKAAKVAAWFAANAAKRAGSKS
jgi:hypothetical protein